MKHLSLVLVFVLLLGLCGCGKASPSLYDRGLEAAALLTEMASSEAYIATYTAMEPIGNLIMERFAPGSCSVPKAVYAISLDPQKLMQYPQALSEELAQHLSHRALAAVISQLNAMEGAETLAAASICTAGTTFVCPGVSDCIYLYTYEDALPIAVTFTTGFDDTVSASATFLADSQLSTDSLETVQAYFAQLGAAVIPVTG